MPTYAYQCTKCGLVDEVLQKMNDRPLRKCKKCSGKLEKLISRSSFALKGGGWFDSGYTKSPGTKAGATKSTSTGKSEGSKSEGSKSEGGKSFIAFYSTADGGEISRIVPRLDPGAVITTPRMDTHYLATEHGIVDLKGKSTKDRALGIIELAHPDFRDELLKAAQEMKLV